MHKVTSIVKVVLKNYHLGVIVMHKNLYVSIKKLTYKKLVGKKLCIKVTSIVKVVLKNYHLEVIVMRKNLYVSAKKLTYKKLVEKSYA